MDIGIVASVKLTDQANLIKDTLVSLGHSVDVLTPGEFLAATKLFDLLIVLIETESLEEADAKLGAFGASGGRMIGIWPDHETKEELPQALESYGFATIPPDLKRLEQLLDELAEPIWEKPDGVGREEPATKRNKC